jgi:hypothetical protein
MVLGLLGLLPRSPFLQIPFVVRMDKPIVTAMNIGILLFILKKMIPCYEISGVPNR